MAEHISTATRFYEDGYIQTLPPTDKFLFKYLLDGPSAEPTLGIYEVSLNTIAFHTGLDKENIEHSLIRFGQADRIFYIDGWVVIKNHFKHNPLRGSEKLVRGAYNRYIKIPTKLKARIENKDDTLYIPYLDPTNTLCIGPELFTALHITTLPVPSLPNSQAGLDKNLREQLRNKGMK